MQPNRRHPSSVALLSLVFLTAALALASVQGSSEDTDVAQMGIEGEGDLPLPVA